VIPALRLVAGGGWLLEREEHRTAEDGGDVIPASSLANSPAAWSIVYL
jgi:hypothetical protein